MKLPLSWLNEFVKIDDLDPYEFAAQLVNIGFEVEEIIDTSEGINNVVTGRIESIEPHPNANKLLVCGIDILTEKVTIITGAGNVKIGDIIPVATDGSTIKNGTSIVSKPLMGVLSHGMLCSGKELGLEECDLSGAGVDGILILPESTPIGIDIKKLPGVFEIVFDISVTSNRPDCQSIFGLAREIAVMLKRELKPPKTDYRAISTVRGIGVEIADYSLCPKYTGRIIEDIKIEPSPLWMQKRLKLTGHTAINNIVDITNYVLVEIGQPLHAFDIRHIDGCITIRTALENEKITALNESEYTLKNNMLVIADDKKVLALAGVMGGKFSGISENTRTVFLESARFARGSIRTTSRALGLRSDSSARYEKGVDSYSVDFGRERALSLFTSLGCGKVTDSKCDAKDEKIPARVIITDTNAICAVLGIRIKEADIIEILSSLGITIKVDGKALICKIPPYREDIDNFTDLAEEVIRFYGYDNIVSKLFKSSANTVGGYSALSVNVSKIKNYLIGVGAFEIISYSFIAKKEYEKLKLDGLGAIEIINPLSEEYAVMRTTLMSGMLNTVSLNLSRKNDGFRLFEIAKTYIPRSLPLKDLPDERETLALGFVGKDESFYDIKAAVIEVLRMFAITEYDIKYSQEPYLHSGISADIFSKNGILLASLGKIHPLTAKNYNISEDVFVAEVHLNHFINEPKKNVVYTKLPKYPAVERDIAVTVKEEVFVGDIIELIKESAKGLLEDARLFDIYRGEQIEKGCKSVAFSLTLRSNEHTLEESEIQTVMNKTVQNLTEKLNAKLRLT